MTLFGIELPLCLSYSNKGICLSNKRKRKGRRYIIFEKYSVIVVAVSSIQDLQINSTMETFILCRCYLSMKFTCWT